MPVCIFGNLGGTSVEIANQQEDHGASLSKISEVHAHLAVIINSELFVSEFLHVVKVGEVYGLFLAGTNSGYNFALFIDDHHFGVVLSHFRFLERTVRNGKRNVSNVAKIELVVGSVFELKPVVIEVLGTFSYFLHIGLIFFLVRNPCFLESAS